MNHRTEIWLVHEIEGPHVAGGFMSEADAKNFLYHEHAVGNIDERYYGIKPIQVENFYSQSSQLTSKG